MSIQLDSVMAENQKHSENKLKPEVEFISRKVFDCKSPYLIKLGKGVFREFSKTFRTAICQNTQGGCLYFNPF